MRSNLVEHKTSGEVIKKDDYIAGLAKGLSLLEAFGIDRQKLNATQVAERTGLSRTAARRYLQTLKFLGYLDSDDHYFWLTHKVMRFTSSYLSSAYLPKIVQPVLNLLSTQTKLIFSLVILDEDEIVPIARSYLPQQDNLRLNPYGAHLGNRLPAHATSTGKVLLATLDREEQKKWVDKYPLKRLTTYTLQDQKQFFHVLDQIQQHGYCLSKEEHELGVIAIAVPLLNAKGKTVAALNCITQTHIFTAEELINQILPLLKNTAFELRSML